MVRIEKKKIFNSTRLPRFILFFVTGYLFVFQVLVVQTNILAFFSFVPIQMNGVFLLFFCYVLQI